MKNESRKYSSLTHRIIGAAMEVHNQLGNGFQEVIYQRALSIELNLRNVAHVREREMELFYKEYPIGTRRVDFFVEEKIMVEIKAIKELEDVHLAQAINYLEAYNMEVGLLINFGKTLTQTSFATALYYMPSSYPLADPPGLFYDRWMTERKRFFVVLQLQENYSILFLNPKVIFVFGLNQH